MTDDLHEQASRLASRFVMCWKGNVVPGKRIEATSEICAALASVRAKATLAERERMAKLLDENSTFAQAIREVATRAEQEACASMRAALREMVYETTSLSPMEDDGSHWCKISREALAAARAALAHDGGSK